jgi:hypothetical protein
MTRSILTGLLGLLSVSAIAIVPLACQSGGVGDPCIPEDEYSADFSGFKVSEENIESRSFQCETRICLVNHFQGRVSCPLGQPPQVACGPSEGCDGGQECVKAGNFIQACVKNDDCGANRRCNVNGKFCECGTDADCPQSGSVPYYCDAKSHQCTTYVCHTKGSCQTADGTAEDNAGKACCIPGTDTPVTSPVCGQCQVGSHRNAQDSVYCTCRCGPPDDESADQKAQDENFNFCDCPTGYSCEEIRKNVGLGDAQITGKYCIKQDTKFTGDTTTCGKVQGYFSSEIKCQGLGG